MSVSAIKTSEEDWECQGGFDTKLGLGRRQMFQDQEMREELTRGVLCSVSY